MLLDLIFDDKTDDTSGVISKKMNEKLKNDPDEIIKRYVNESNIVIHKYEQSNNIKEKLDAFKRGVFLISLGAAILNAVLTFFSFGITNKLFSLLRMAIFGLIAKLFSKPEVGLLKKSAYYKKDLLIAYNKLNYLKHNTKIPQEYRQEISENLTIIKSYLDDINAEERITDKRELQQKNSTETLDNIYDTFYRY